MKNVPEYQPASNSPATQLGQAEGTSVCEKIHHEYEQVCEANLGSICTLQSNSIKVQGLFKNQSRCCFGICTWLAKGHRSRVFSNNISWSPLCGNRLVILFWGHEHLSQIP